eukprot:UN30745
MQEIDYRKCIKIMADIFTNEICNLIVLYSQRVYFGESWASYSTKCITHMELDYECKCGGTLNSGYRTLFLDKWLIFDKEKTGCILKCDLHDLCEEYAKEGYSEWKLTDVDKAEMEDEFTERTVSLLDFCLYSERWEVYHDPRKQGQISQIEKKDKSNVMNLTGSRKYEAALRWGLRHLEVQTNDKNLYIRREIIAHLLDEWRRYDKTKTCVLL